MIYGHFAVAVFIVLSGFSLAVSPARHDWKLNGTGRFFHRRAWRILPPYWAALVFSLLVAWLIIPQPGLPEPTAMSVIANGLLFQDVIDAPTPNRAFWTIAVEAQLYLVFPLLLLFIRRVSGFAMLAAVAAMVAAVGALAPYSPVAHWLMRLTPQFAALFALGMVAAGIVGGAAGSAEKVRASKRYRDWPWHWLALASAAPVLVIIVWKGSVWTIGANLFWIDLALGPAIGCLFAALATGRPASLVRLFEHRPDAHPRLDVLQPLPDPPADRDGDLRGTSGRPDPHRHSDIPALARHRGSGDTHLRPALRGRLRDPVRASPRLGTVAGRDHATAPRRHPGRTDHIGQSRRPARPGGYAGRRGEPPRSSQATADSWTADRADGSEFGSSRSPRGQSAGQLGDRPHCYVAAGHCTRVESRR